MLKKLCIFCSELAVGVELATAANMNSLNTITLNATVHSKCAVTFGENSLSWNLDTGDTNESMEDMKKSVEIQFTGCTDGSNTPISFLASEVGDDCARATNADSSKVDEQSYIRYCFFDEDNTKLPVVEAGKSEKQHISNLSTLNDTNTKSIWIYPQRDVVDIPLIEGNYTGMVTITTDIN